MTDPKPRDASELESPDALSRDDELLSALGRGDRPVGGDEVGAMLAAWRADLDDPPVRTLRAPVPGPETVTLIPVTQVAAPRVQGRATLPGRSVRPKAPSPNASARPTSPGRAANP